MAWVYTAERFVDAPPERVWQVLVDLERYREWNPFTPRVRGPLVVGEPVHLTARMWPWMGGLDIPMDETLRAIDPPRRLVWGERILGGLVVAERVQTLEPEGKGTRYRTVDTIGGPLAGLNHLLFGRSLHDGFDAMAGALAERAASS
jgi:uncharacterized protein YndB with AHSA1/START domain